MKTLKKPQKARAAVWKYFGFETGKGGQIVDERHVVCSLCREKVGYSGNTSNLSTHLANRHKEVSANLASGSKLTQSTIKIDKDGFTPATKLQKYAPASTRAVAITGAIANFIAEDLRPISIVEGSGFRKMMAAVEPRYQVPCHQTMTKILHKQRDDKVAAIKKKVADVPYVGMTTDLWTSIAGDNYCCLTAHYITPAWEMESAVIACHKLLGERTAHMLAAYLNEEATAWALHDKIVGLSTDNGSNIVRATELLQWEHFRCVGHTMQLCLKPALALPAVDTLLTRASKIVTFFNKSYKAKEQLAEKQQQLGIRHHSLLQSVDTRWNSSFSMLERLNEQAIAVSAVLMSSTKQKHRELMLTPVEQKLAMDLCKVFQPVADATKILSGHFYPSLSYVWPVIVNLQSVHFQDAPDDSNVIAEVKQLVREQLESRYMAAVKTSARQKYLLASIVDPRFKELEVFSKEDRRCAAECLEDAVQKVMAGKEGADKVSSEVEQQPPPKLARTASGRFFGASSRPSSESASSTTCKSTAKAKVQKYLRESSLEMESNPLQWWQYHCKVHPEVAEVARKLLCIPATSVPSESLFSDAGNVVNKKRASLSPANVECLVLLYANLKRQ